MATFKVETKNKVDIDKKSRVYFTCHPDDFKRCFQKICDDVFKTHDCAIYYTENMSETVIENERETKFSRINLIIIPVTFNLLTTANRAMDEDIPYALKHNIPVLPIMMEPGIDEFYSKPDKFGELQYLNPYSTDLTEISYEEKLKKYLKSVLISDELAKRVRAAFDAYIFLSYRKKDRTHANELMRVIHSIPECRNIAIWFDEFLTPGESFKENIEEILDDCQLFTLLVTPRLLEKDVDENGKESANYVISTELPLARKKKVEKGTDIFSVEMEKTDKDALAVIDIEDYVNINDKDFRGRLLDSISRIAITTNNTPEHNFLIGLAYLEGIDVEKNFQLAIQLIENAAEQNLREALKFLVNIYYVGIETEKDISLSIKHQKTLIDSLKQDNSMKPNILEYLEEELHLARLEMEANLLKDARNTCWKVIKQCKNNGGYGTFLEENRIESYVQAYLLLGEIFLKRDDIVQSKECFKKVQDTLDNEINNSIKTEFFTKGYLYYRLAQIFSTGLFYDFRYVISNYEKAIYYFNMHNESSCSNQVQTYIDSCNLRIAEECEKIIDKTDEAVTRYEYVSNQYSCLDYTTNIDELIAIAYANYRLGVLHQKQENIKTATAKYEYSIKICNEARQRYGDNFDIVKIFLFASIKLHKLHISLNRKNIEFYELLMLAENYCKKIKTRATEQLLADFYIELFEFNQKYGLLAYRIYEELVTKHPEFYSQDFWKLRNYLWGKKVLCESDFKKTELLVTHKDDNNFLWYNVAPTKSQYKLKVEFIKCCPLGEIKKITITDYLFQKFKGVSVAHHQIEPHIEHIQLCTNTNIMGVRITNIPDETVLITYENGTTIPYRICYG